MPSISRDKRTGTWIVRWRDAEGNSRSRSHKTVGDAETLLAALEAGDDPARPRKDDKREQGTLITEVLATYLRVEGMRFAPRTLTSYATALDLFLTFLAERRIVRAPGLSRALLEDYRVWLGTPQGAGPARAPNTIAKICQVAELAWEWAADADRWSDIPRSRRLKHKIVRPQPSAPSLAEVDAMIRCLSATHQAWSHRAPAKTASDWIVRLAILARYTGERRSALLQLRWSHLDLARGAVQIPNEITKGGYGGRTVPLHPDLANRLRDWPRLGPTIVAAPPLELTGRGHCDRNIRRAWVRAGVPEERWTGQPVHAARKSLRTTLVAAGVQADVIDAFLGHSGEGTGGRSYTDRAHLWPAMVAALATIPPLDLDMENSP